MDKKKSSDTEDAEVIGVEDAVSTKKTQSTAESEQTKQSSQDGETKPRGFFDNTFSRFGRSKEVKPDKQESAAEERTRKGFMERLDNLVFLLVRALLFGVIAAAAGVAAVLFMRSFVDPQSGNEEFQTELMRLDAEIQDLKSRSQALQGKIGGFETQLEGILGNAGQAAQSADLLSDNLEQLKGEVAAGLAGAEGGVENLRQIQQDNELRFADLTENVEAIRVRLGQLAVQPPGSNVEEASDSSVRPNGEATTSVVVDNVSKLNSEVRAVEERIAALRSDMSDGLNTIEQRLSAIESAEPEVFNPSPLEGRIDTLEQQVAAVSGVGTLTRSQAQRVTLLSVRSAVQAGAPYAALLADANLHESEIPKILLAFSETGVRTLQELQGDFLKHSRSLLKSPEAGGDGMLGALSRLVRVRPLTPREGTSTAAVLSRAESLLQANDVAGAIASLRELSDTGVEAMSDWIRAAEDRVAALAAIDSLLSENQPE